MGDRAMRCNRRRAHDGTFAMIPRTALLAVMESEAAHRAVSKDWARTYWLGARPQVASWRGMAAILEPNRSERHLTAQWNSIQAGTRAHLNQVAEDRVNALRALASEGTVLPAAYEQGLTPARARLFLIGNEPKLAQALRDLAGLAQYSLSFARPLDNAALNTVSDEMQTRLMMHLNTHVADMQFSNVGVRRFGAPDLTVLAHADALPLFTEAVERFCKAAPDLLPYTLSQPTPPTEFRAAGLPLPNRREILKAEILMDIPATATEGEVKDALKAQVALIAQLAEPEALSDLTTERERAGLMLARIANARRLLLREGIEADPWDIPQFQLMRGNVALEKGGGIRAVIGRLRSELAVAS